MLRTTSQSISADLDEMVEGLLREDLEYDRKENRTALRESLMRCVSVDPGLGADCIDGFSRNVSHSGIGRMPLVQTVRQAMVHVRVAVC